MKNKREKTDLQKFLHLMNQFKIDTFLETDEYDYVEIRLKNKHHNSVPIFSFDETGKYYHVSTALANEQCNLCGGISIYKIND